MDSTHAIDLQSLLDSEGTLADSVEAETGFGEGRIHPKVVERSNTAEILRNICSIVDRITGPPDDLPPPDDRSEATGTLSLSPFAVAHPHPPLPPPSLRLPPPEDFADSFQSPLSDRCSIQIETTFGSTNKELSDDRVQSKAADPHHFFDFLTRFETGSESNAFSASKNSPCGREKTSNTSTQSSSSDFFTTPVTSEDLPNKTVKASERTLIPTDRPCGSFAQYFIAPNCMSLPQMSPTVENSSTSADRKPFVDGANVKQLKTSKDDSALKLEYEKKLLIICKESNFIESVLPEGLFESGKGDAHNPNSTENINALIGQKDRLIMNIDEKRSIACGDWPASLGEEVQRSKSCGSKVSFVNCMDIITPPEDFMTMEDKLSRQRKVLTSSAADDSTNETAQTPKSVPVQQRPASAAAAAAAAAAASYYHPIRMNEISSAADSVPVFNSNSPSANKSIHRSRSRPKFSPPQPPSDLSREQRSKYDHLDRISLCQYNGSSKAAASVKGETEEEETEGRTMNAFLSSSTANLTEAKDGDDCGPPSLRRPPPPRRSCSIPRKTVVRNLSEDERPSASSLDHIPAAAATAPPPLTVNSKWPLKTTRSIRAFKDPHSTEKPTAQIRPNALRSATSAIDTKRSVESLIQHYNQKDSAAPIDDDIHEDKDNDARRHSSNKSSVNTSTKFGSLRGKLKDYVSTSNNKKQNYSANYKTSANAVRVKEKMGGKQVKSSQATKSRDTKPSDFEIRDEEREEEEVAIYENSDGIRPNYVSSYLSFATPKPYMPPPPRTTSLSTAQKNSRTNSSNALKTFLGSHKGNAPQNSPSFTSSRKQVLGSETISSIRSVNIFADADNESVESNGITKKLSSSSSDDLPPSANYDQNGEISFLSDFVSSTQTAAAFTREATSNMSTFRNWGSSGSSTGSPSGAAATFTEEPRRRHPPSSTVKEQNARRSEGNTSEEETPMQENRRESSTTFRRSNSDDKKPHHIKTPSDQQNPKGFKHNRGDFLSENLDPVLNNLMEKLRTPIPEQRRGDSEDLEKSKELLVLATRQFVCDSQLLVSDATRQSESLPRNFRTSVETLSRIAEHCVATVSVLGPTSQAVILNNRVMDLAEAFRATVAVVRKAVGKPLNCPEMKALMRQATSLAANISSLLKLINRI